MQKVYTKSLIHSLTDEACSHKVFPNGQPKKGLHDSLEYIFLHSMYQISGHFDFLLFYSSYIYIGLYHPVAKIHILRYWPLKFWYSGFFVLFFVFHMKPFVPNIETED